MNALLVDNDRLLLDALRLTIEARHPEIDVDCAVDDVQAIARVAQVQYELVLLDWWLNSGPAEATFLRIKELNPNGRIVVMSGDDSSWLVNHALELGAAGFLRKNVADFDALQQAVSVVTRGGVYLPGQVPLQQAASPSVRPQWAARELGDCFPGVTDRQLAVLRVLLRGKSDKHIARELDIALSTVKTHVQALFRQLGVASRAEAVAMAARLGARID